jgi:hypothetical protein
MVKPIDHGAPSKLSVELGGPKLRKDHAMLRAGL